MYLIIFVLAIFTSTSNETTAYSTKQQMEAFLDEADEVENKERINRLFK